MFDKDICAEQLREIREKYFFTYRELAEDIGIAMNTLANVIHKKNKPIQMRVKRRLHLYCEEKLNGK
jgi:transcriptional regulator with XRE-family HTH domain